MHQDHAARVFLCSIANFLIDMTIDESSATQSG